MMEEKKSEGGGRGRVGGGGNGGEVKEEVGAKEVEADYTLIISFLLFLY